MTRLPLKDRFVLPEGVIYLDGNSLGPLPVGVADRVNAVMQKEWAGHLVKGWNVDDWMGQPVTVADRVGRLIGAAPGTTVLGDTLSLKVHQALSAALRMRPDRKVILSDTGNFPTDLYMAQGLIRQLGHGHELRTVAPGDVAEAIDDNTAAVMLTHVDYRTGRMHDLAAITAKAHDAGAVMIWDLAHSAGAVLVDIAGCGAEFAIGCTYKYLNAGPGAPAFITVRPDVADTVFPALSGWLGHEAPFAFDPDYRPGPGIERFRVGTPPVLQVAALDAAMDAWDGVEMSDIRAASMALCEQFIAEVESRIPALRLASPRDPEHRGSQVSFHFEHGYAAMQALIARDVIGDFRAPDIMRFGFTPLYIGPTDVTNAVDVLAEVMDKRLWDRAEYHAKSRVT
ncbi:MAG: kynureninase [Pseudomonadota bacterium]